MDQIERAFDQCARKMSVTCMNLQAENVIADEDIFVDEQSNEAMGVVEIYREYDLGGGFELAVTIRKDV